MRGMRTYRRAAHTVYELHYHFVFTTKYRKPVLRGEIAVEVRDLIRQICRGNDIDILAGHVRPDHVHLLVSVPPHLAPSRVMQAIKGKTSHRLLMDRRTLREEFWGRHLWARGYFACSSGNVTDEMIEEYIRTQGAEPQDDERFKISE
jgi:putative transposase